MRVLALPVMVGLMVGRGTVDAISDPVLRTCSIAVLIYSGSCGVGRSWGVVERGARDARACSKYWPRGRMTYQASAQASALLERSASHHHNPSTTRSTAVYLELTPNFNLTMVSHDPVYFTNVQCSDNATSAVYHHVMSNSSPTNTSSVPKQQTNKQPSDRPIPCQHHT